MAKRLARTKDVPKRRRDAPLVTPSDLKSEAFGTLPALHAVFALYLKTKNFHWLDETERRTWDLFEASRRVDSTGH